MGKQQAGRSIVQVDRFIQQLLDEYPDAETVRVYGDPTIQALDEADAAQGDIAELVADVDPLLEIDLERIRREGAASIIYQTEQYDQFRTLQDAHAWVLTVAVDA